MSLQPEPDHSIQTTILGPHEIVSGTDPNAYKPPYKQTIINKGPKRSPAADSSPRRSIASYSVQLLSGDSAALRQRQVYRGCFIILPLIKTNLAVLMDHGRRNETANAQRTIRVPDGEETGKTVNYKLRR